MASFHQKIRTRFDTASSSYESVAQIQKESARHLVQMLREEMAGFSPATILDLGTGTGYVPEFLLPHFPTATYTLNECAMGMLRQAQKKFFEQKKFFYHHGDMETESFVDYDLITSNLALQWVSHFDVVIQKFSKRSKFFAFSCPLAGTFKEWEKILREEVRVSPIGFLPEENALLLFLSGIQNKRLSFELRDIQMRFASAHAFMRYLKALGASGAMTSLSPGKIRRLIQTHREAFSVTYRLFFGIMKSQF